jgi:hypothetical protein
LSNPNLPELIAAIERAAGPLHDVPYLLQKLEEQAQNRMSDEELVEWRHMRGKLLALHNRVMARI